MKSVVFVFLAVSAQATPPPGPGPTPLPTQCHNEILELSPIRYIAAGTNYSNCELKGQVGTVIQGSISLESAWGPLGSGYENSLVLSGTMVLDQMSLALFGKLHIKGDDIMVKDTHIEGTVMQEGTRDVAVVGGRVSFERRCEGFPLQDMLSLGCVEDGTWMGQGISLAVDRRRRRVEK